MATIEKALQIAARAHEGQVDKEGLPYILHPLRVMDVVQGLEAKMVAVLHDVVEDTAVTFDDLEREGFSAAVLAALRCVTHAEGESYADYAVRCQADPIARQVKLSSPIVDNDELDKLRHLDGTGPGGFKAITLPMLYPVKEGVAESVNGAKVNVRADCICVHSDTPNAVQVAQAVKAAVAEYLA